MVNLNTNLNHYNKCVDSRPSIFVTESSLHLIYDVFMTKNGSSKTERQKSTNVTFYLQSSWSSMTILHRHRIYDDPISSVAIWPCHIRSYLASLTWQNYDEIKSSWSKISPVHFGGLHGLSPLIPAFFSRLSLFLVRSCFGPQPFYRFFYFGPWPSYSPHFIFYFPTRPTSDFIFQQTDSN
jgi:hypothetical protein